jgi:muramoyltetrapeptide carboxypeptidase
MLDFRQLARADKHWVGLSDFTAFHLAMLARAGARTWAGPALLDDFAVEAPEQVDEVTLGCFQEAMSGELEMLGFRASSPVAVDARGTLWGGNLSVLCSLVGTPYIPEVQGGVLFLEDVAEHPYRIERMLTQLLNAGVLSQQKAIVLGAFTDYKLTSHDKGYKLNSVVSWLRAQVKTPVLTGLPFGHVPTKLCLPVGQEVSLLREGREAFLLWAHQAH